MKLKRFWETFIVSALIGAGTLIFKGPRQAPAPLLPAAAEPVEPPAFELRALLDWSILAHIVWVNDSGKPCKATLVGGSDKGVRANLTTELPTGKARQAIHFPGPFKVETVAIERDGSMKSHELKVTVPAGSLYEIHIGKDDGVTMKPAPQ